MLTEELSVWKCVYCETQNDHTDHRCFNCNKKKPKWSTAKRILKRKENEAKKITADTKKAKIEKLTSPQVDDTSELTFDITKLKSD